ncbi:hypothetical protein HGB47_09280 [Leptospira yasudae]|uniref:hypothetical protein n=1 Tax=Leptospira yasudae TaxID=2202201 RepID=UPI001C4F51DB|nr:hypothetical protein [Leptospira yasudae]MBW0433808.1 hypothetical protein [Leptospira yasudae]
MTEIKNKLDRTLRIDVIFAVLFFLVSAKFHSFLGMHEDMEAEDFTRVKYVVAVFAIGLLFFASVDIALLMEKKIDRRLRVLICILSFVCIFAELAYYSKSIRFFWDLFVQASADLEEGQPMWESMKSEFRQIFSVIAIGFFALRTLIRLIWNFFWSKAILAFD